MFVRRILGSMFCLGMMVMPGAVYAADCSDPSRPEGTILYNTDHKTLQYCDGTNWKAPQSSAGGGKGHGYFVLTESKWNGNLGNLAGADAKCLGELQSKNWVGKADAQARGILTAAKTKAFLCNSTTCNNLEATTSYLYARASYSIDGHSGFTTDANGAGPGSSGDYYWDDEWVFGVNDEFWSNRALGTSARWGTTPRFATSARTCTDFTSASASLRGRTGSLGASNTGRWDLYDEYCNIVTYGRLICYVNP